MKGQSLAANGSGEDRLRANLRDMRDRIRNLEARRPTGAIGPPGPPGPPGPAGAYLLEQTFAVAASTWVGAHMQGTKGLNVYTENLSGDEILGDVSYPDVNHVHVDFAHPQTGVLRVFN